MIFSDFPLAPEKMKIPTKDLSEYQKNLLEIMKDIKYKRVPTEKLMLTLYDKEKYIVHYQNLKLYLSLGMKLKKIHRILSFKQSKWLKTFIDLNTELRKNSTTEFEIALWKLISNAFYGKTVESKRNHLSVKCALTERQVKFWTKKPTFESFYIVDENKAIIKLKKNKVVLDRPIYVGFTVLELSKNLMYNYHYNVFKQFYNTNIHLCYTDTDSFIYHIFTKDLFNDKEI
jgi:hypothetical protein